MADTMTLDLAHYSLQFSDGPKKKNHDARELYSHDYDAIFGTEAGSEETRRILRVSAHDAGYTLFVRGSNWVSIKKSLIVPKSYRTGYQAFVPAADTLGPGADLHVTWASCKIKDLGRASFMASHYATEGRLDARNPGPNLDENRELARGIGNLAERLGAENDLVFYGGDQNMIDREHDTFFGEPLTSAWDELGKYESTGPANIDLIASYDKDARVEATYIRALDDEEQFMHMDHYPVEAGFKVKLLKS